MVEKLIEFLRRVKLPSIVYVIPGTQSGENPIKKVDAEKLENVPEVMEEPCLIVDTSSLIDGRIVEIAESGFMAGTFIVPSYVIDELHQVSDSKDSEKRNRGRNGLDVLKRLKKVKYTKFKIFRAKKNDEEVDTRLLRLARRMKGRVITTDYNLIKVGEIAGIVMLNVNDLAKKVRTVVLPGEKMTINLVKTGKNENQGVGYLSDGTMVVVDCGKELIGKDVEVEVQRFLQTDAGKMVFASITVDT